MGVAASVTEETAVRDTGAMLDFLAMQPEVAGTKVGTAGYYMGGSFALTAAGRFPGRVAAAASFHGGHIAGTEPDSPHLLAGSMKAKIYIAGAENDASFDAEEFERLSTALTDANVEHTLVTYPAAHGFAVPDNPTPTPTPTPPPATGRLSRISTPRRSLRDMGEQHDQATMGAVHSCPQT